MNGVVDHTRRDHQQYLRLTLAAGSHAQLRTLTLTMLSGSNNGSPVLITALCCFMVTWHILYNAREGGGGLIICYIRYMGDGGLY